MAPPPSSQHHAPASLANEKRKQPSTPASAGPPKRSRQSSASALQEISAGLADFNETFRHSMTGSKPGVQASPVRKGIAMQRLQELEDDLTDDQIVSLLDLFQKDVTEADTYNNIKREGVRRTWVQSRIDSLSNPFS